MAELKTTTIQWHKIDVISNGNGQMVSKVSKLFQRKKGHVFGGALTGRQVSRIAQDVITKPFSITIQQDFIKMSFSHFFLIRKN